MPKTRRMLTLESSNLFGHLPTAELVALRAATQERGFAAGQTIFQEGDPGDGIYIVKTGRVQISAPLENGERHIFSEVLPGDVFGEMAVMDQQSRSACASAETETPVYFVPREEMLKLLKRSPELAITLVQEISGRLREFNRQYIRKLLQAERMALVGRFASSIVHDLKNPLTVISLCSELLCTGASSEEARKTAEHRINQQLERITGMVNDILEFTRGANLNLELTATDYGEFVRALVEDSRSELALKSVVLHYDNEPPSIKLPLNPRRLSRIFYNLFGNAADAMPSGGELKLRFHVTNTEVITEIEDTGPGIAPEVVDHLFEAFVTFGKRKGTGLGLSIAQKIIEEHHGKISARNRPGGGAIFSITLRRSIAPLENPGL